MIVACDGNRRIMPSGKYERKLATCIDCDAAYAVKKWSEGTIQPIGCNKCQCGSTEFRAIDYSPDPAFQTEKTA